MRVLVVFCLLAVAIGDKEQVTDDRVLDLTTDIFDDTIASNPVILVEFYAPWCGHCKQLAPEYASAAAQLASDNPPVPLAKVDATVQTDLASRFGIDGYPTMKVFHNGVAYDYEGPRTAQGIVDYMRLEASPDWKPPVDQVIVLTAENFTDIVTEAKLILVEFYAPWCGHCKRLAPEYSKAAKDLVSHGVVLAKVDATVETELASKYSVSGYPTLKMFRYGKVYEYAGPRERYGIVQYMSQQVRPASQLIETKRELDQFLKNTGALVIMTFALEPNTLLYENHEDLANAGRDSPLTFVHTFSDSVGSSVGVIPNSAAILTSARFQSQYEPAVRALSDELFLGSDNVTTRLDTLIKLARPLVGIRSKNIRWYDDTSYPLLVAYTEIDLTDKNFDILRDQLLPLANEFIGHVTFAISDEAEFADDLKALGFDDWGEDVAIAIWAGAREKYPLMEEVDKESLRQFIEEFLSGSLKPFLRSQPRPSKQHGPVTVVVGSNFEDIVMDVDKHVLVEFYAPWCGHCKKLEPKYKKLAKQFKDNKSFVIAKFDATANDAPPEFEFTGFPTLFFVSAQTNEVSIYQGDREVKAMSKYIQKKAKSFTKSDKKKKYKEEL